MGNKRGFIPRLNRNGKLNKNIVVAAILVLVVILICIAGYIVRMFMPSKEKMELTDYYPVPADRVMMVMQDEIEEEYGLYIDKVAYAPYELVKSKINKRFYWDANENVLSYTTPNEVIRVGLDVKEYQVEKTKASEDYVIVKMRDEKVYLAMDFVKKYSNVEYQVHENPNRMVVQYKWGSSFLYANVKKETWLRYEPDIKSPYLEQLAPDAKLLIDQSEEFPKGFYRAITDTGIVGYVKARHLKKSYYETLESDYEEEPYTHMDKEGTINLVWHQVTNQTGNENVLNLLNNTKGVTVISPTWFSIKDNKGNISSLASERYVERAHMAGVEVWALCNDFDKNMKIGKVLKRTSRRERLIKELILEAIKYDLDGLNIDFEYVPKENGEDFIQFIRELSVKCRQNRIVLSIDNYPPTEYTAYYDREEQGIVADYVITMAYDEHYPGGGKSGSVSSVGYVSDSVRNTLAQVPPERTIIALPFYTRLWKEKPDGEGVKVTSEAYGVNGAETVLKNYGVEARWDEETAQDYAEFDGDGAKYKIWLENEASLEEKMKVVMEQNVAGVAFWKLGLERESVWDAILKHIEQ